MTCCVDRHDAFRIPLGQHLLSTALHRARRAWRWLGDLEAEVLRDQLEAIPIDRPIYIAGLARSGSTILLEVLAAHQDVATHQYRDFWSVFTPVWASRADQAIPRAVQQPVERSHGDGIFVTRTSPEAIEEMVWMEFFPHAHDPRCSQVLDDATSHPRFERTYTAHLRKLLLVRQRVRYASKANYNLTRLNYLLRLFPDARFVLPIRDPREHVASLIKQHRLLQAAAGVHPRSVHYLNRVGHFEFGRGRIPINAGDTVVIDQIQSLWRRGDEVRGWARYWAHLHGYLADQLDECPRLRDASLVVKYDDLCDDSQQQLVRLLEHVQLDAAEPIIEAFRSRLRRPNYYRPEFTEDEQQTIADETAAVAERFELANTRSPALT